MLRGAESDRRCHHLRVVVAAASVSLESRDHKISRPLDSVHVASSKAAYGSAKDAVQ